MSITWSEISIDRIEFESTPPAQLEFKFAGKFEAEGWTSIARNDLLHGGELEHVQGDAIVGGRFTFGLSWTPNDPVGQFEYGRVLLEDWQADLSVDGGSYLQCGEDFFCGANQMEGDDPTLSPKSTSIVLPSRGRVETGAGSSAEHYQRCHK